MPSGVGQKPLSPYLYLLWHLLRSARARSRTLRIHHPDSMVSTPSANTVWSSQTKCSFTHAGDKCLRQQGHALFPFVDGAIQLAFIRAYPLPANIESPLVFWNALSGLENDRKRYLIGEIQCICGRLHASCVGNIESCFACHLRLHPLVQCQTCLQPPGACADPCGAECQFAAKPNSFVVKWTIHQTTVRPCVLQGVQQYG